MKEKQLPFDINGDKVIETRALAPEVTFMTHPLRRSLEVYTAKLLKARAEAREYEKIIQAIEGNIAQDLQFACPNVFLSPKVLRGLVVNEGEAWAEGTPKPKPVETDPFDVI